VPLGERLRAVVSRHREAQPEHSLLQSKQSKRPKQRVAEACAGPLKVNLCREMQAH
jgi:hypothetical protein